MRKIVIDEIISELQERFSDLINDSHEDPLEPINPLTYKNIGGDTCLHIAVRRNDLWSVEKLIELGLDVNGIGDMGSTPLHYAIASRNQKIIDMLIFHGASREIKDEFGRLSDPDFAKES